MPDRGRLAEKWRPFSTATWASCSCARLAGGFVLRIKRSLLWIKREQKPADDPQDPAGPGFQAQKMESLGRLTGGVAHDFNNLLTVVLGNATALRVQAESRGDAKAMQRAEIIERAAERGGRLAGQLLAFSGKQMLRPEAVSVYRVISATHEVLAQAAGESARVLLHAEPGLWNCLVDPGQLESAILNLVLNARDAMPIGGNITISCHNNRIRRSGGGKTWHRPGRYVRIDVTDHGIGIPVELREKVFEPFFTTRPVGQGSGLGLPQVHGFAGQSGGWVELDSTVGSGTTISLFLPRADGPDSEPLAGADGPQADRNLPGGHGQTVLVVEPDLDNRMTTCETLIRSGYRAVGVADSGGAFGLLVSNAKIDALLIDALLPGGVSGLALGRSACQARPGLCVLVTSSNPNQVDEPADPPAGCEATLEIIMKPDRAADLVRILGASLTIKTLSIETEQLLADAPRDASLAGAAVGQSSGEVGPSPARQNAIRLGVMPFRAIGAASDNAFSAGLAEEITAAFARFRWITCIAPASVAALADEPPHTDRWAELDLDFLVQGSFRRKRNDIRVVLRLTNLRGSGEMTWGRRFDGILSDVRNLEDLIASETAARIAPELLVWESRLEAGSRPQVDPTAYDMKLRAIPATYCLDEAGFREAGVLLEKSLVLDPSSADCHSWLAHWYLFSLGQGWATDVAYATQRAEELSRRAVELDPGDARGLTVAGHVRAFLRKDAQGALALHERAIELNPNLAIAWCYSGLAHSYLGHHQEAIRRIEHAKHLSPHDPHGFFFDTALGLPLLLTGQYEAAAQAGRQARSQHAGVSSAAKLLLAALGYLGATREAASIRKALLALEPYFSIRAATSRSPLGRPADLDCYVQGLRLAGVPERHKGRFMSLVHAT